MRGISVAGRCFVLIAATGMSSQAIAGPCSDQIAGVARTLSSKPDVSGSPTTGTLNGAGPNGSTLKPVQTDKSKQMQATSATGKLHGDAGSRDVTATASGIATSPEDVQRQQAGVPTSSDDPSRQTPRDSFNQAKAQLEIARALDAKGDAGCHKATEKAAELSRAS